MKVITLNGSRLYKDGVVCQFRVVVDFTKFVGRFPVASQITAEAFKAQLDEFFSTVPQDFSGDISPGAALLWYLHTLAIAYSTDDEANAFSEEIGALDDPEAVGVRCEEGPSEGSAPSSGEVDWMEGDEIDVVRWDIEGCEIS